jgi:hypothetical protein
MGEAVLDSYCPHHENFRLTPPISRVVIELVQKLDAEKKRRLISGDAERRGI